MTRVGSVSPSRCIARLARRHLVDVLSNVSVSRRASLSEDTRPEVVEALRRRAAAIRGAGAVSIMQLLHLGRETLATKQRRMGHLLDLERTAGSPTAMPAPAAAPAHR
jgi:2,4-dienoyl-CoA reductase-like NADH-dependent reductase (Old Yellow Enzyme family)